MSKQERAQPDQQNESKRKPNLLAGQGESQNVSMLPVLKLLGLYDQPSIQAQASQLNDPRFQTRQRQTMAAHLGQVAGNHYLQRVLTSGERQVVQRQEPQATPGEPEATSTKANPLIDAVKRGDEGAIKSLLKDGADINAQDEFGWTPLMYAADEGQLAIAKLLLKKETNLEILSTSSPTGDTCLKLAVRGKHNDMVELLLKHGANLHTLDRIKWNAPIWAAREGNLGAVQLFLKHGLDINWQDEDGFTLLIHAANACQLEVVKWLVENGADLSVLTKKGKNALSMSELMKEAYEWELGNETSRVISDKEEDARLKKEEQQQKIAQLMAKVTNCEQVIAYLKEKLSAPLVG